MEDDQAFLPPFNASLNIRQEVYEEFPQLGDLFEPITTMLDGDTMIGLNAEVDVDGEDPEDVARGFLEENGFIAAE